MNMNKVCFFNLSTYSSTGGIERYNQFFLKALNELNIKTTALSVYDSENKDQYPNIKFKNFATNKISASIYLLKNIYKVEKLIVAHINLLPIVIISKIINPKLSVYISIYGIEVWVKFSYFYRFFLKKIKFLSISSYTTNVFSKLNNLKQSDVYYLPPGINLNLINNLGNFYNDQEFNILSVARLHKTYSYKSIDNKGIDGIIRSLPMLINDIPNIKYTIIGDGNDKRRLVRLSQSLGVEKHVDFKGFVENTEPYYKYCDVFVLPSKGEGFGIAYLEAMKYKKPCIASDKGGQTDVVIDNKTGFLCEYDDIQCLSSKTVKLFKDKKLVNKFGGNGYEHLVNNFTFERFKNRLSSILNN
jgi:phosphatidyl-myo-inositol dimannoside synthase